MSAETVEAIQVRLHGGPRDGRLILAVEPRPGEMLLTLADIRAEADRTFAEPNERGMVLGAEWSIQRSGYVFA